MDVLCEKLPDAGLLHVDLRNDVVSCFSADARQAIGRHWLTEKNGQQSNRHFGPTLAAGVAAGETADFHDRVAIRGDKIRP